jgi:VIT1/CCC1 family predicted Fe2+/Mn2+ transporter
VEKSNLKIWVYLFIIKIFGLTFGLKLMESREEHAIKTYEKIKGVVPEVTRILREENEHERKLINLIDEERLRYIGSIVLGLNDALVELTGAIAGFTFALQNARLIAVVGLITGIAASLSMGASEYLATKSEERDKSPVKASVYTGVAYILTVLFLVAPFFMFTNVFLALGVTIINAVIVILVFTFYVSVAKDIKFKGRFLEMVGISLGVAGLSFIIGVLVRVFLGFEI